MSKKSRILDARGEPVPAQAPTPAPQPAIVPARRMPNAGHAKFPTAVDDIPFFVRVTAAGTGDSIFLAVGEILALEVNSETSRCQFVLKNGSVLPVIEDPEVVITRLIAERF